MVINDMRLFSMNDPASYSRKWDEYHRRQKLFLIAWGSFFPGVLIVSWLLRSLINLSSWHSGLIAFVVFGGGCIASQFHLELWRCPRCGESFCRSAFVHWPFAVGCMHCGLRRYTTDDQIAS